MAAIIHVRHAKTNLIVFLLCFCAIFLCQSHASLLDPNLIGKELQKFAKDALGVDEMQVSEND